MELYFAGVAVALLIGIVKSLSVLGTLFSTQAKNFKTIGLHYQFSTGSFTATEFSPWGLVGFLAWVLVITPPFSWLTVGSAAWAFFKAQRAKAGISDALKAAVHRIRTQPMNKEQMVEFQEELAKANLIAGPVRTGSEGDDDPTCLDLSSGDGWGAEIRVDPTRKTFVYHAHTPEYDSVFDSTEEYRFEGPQVFTRLIEDRVDNYSKKSWWVRDGVVLESELRARAEKGHTFKPVEQEIAEYKARVEWHPMENHQIRFFLMSQHPAEYPIRERRRLVRTELERMDAAARKLIQVAVGAGLRPQEDENGTQFYYPDGASAEDKERMSRAVSDEALREIGITQGEVSQMKKIRANLLALLGEQVPEAVA